MNMLVIAMLRDNYLRFNLRRQMLNTFSLLLFIGFVAKEDLDRYNLVVNVNFETLRDARIQGNVLRSADDEDFVILTRVEQPVDLKLGLFHAQTCLADDIREEVLLSDKVLGQGACSHFILDQGQFVIQFLAC